jgi:hypothetical protein
MFNCRIVFTNDTPQRQKSQRVTVFFFNLLIGFLNRLRQIK